MFKIGNKTIIDIFKVFISNFLKLLSGVLVGFLLPKILGVEDYGYYKVFTLYAAYIGLFVIGICDGIYLKYGGKSYEEIKESNFQSYTFILFIIQIILSIFLALISLLFLKNEYRIIFLFLAAFLTLSNLTGYYQMISQITSRFSEYSFRTIIQSVITSAIIVLFRILHRFLDWQPQYYHYLFFYVGMYLVLMLRYIFTYKDITFRKLNLNKETYKDILYFIKIGMPLMISNLCSTLILTIDRQFVNIFFDINTYAVYSFAYNMLSLITVATTALGTVLYPTFKKANIESLKNKYPIYISIVTAMVAIMLFVYYPLCIFVQYFLPKYIDSLPIFRIILPGLALSAPITIVMHNYYKVCEKNVMFFMLNLIILILSIGANFFAYYIFKSTLAVSIASVCCIVIWYIMVDFAFSKTDLKKNLPNYLFTFLIILSFYIITLIDLIWLGFAIQIVITLCLILLFYGKRIFVYLKSRKDKNNEKSID